MRGCGFPLLLPSRKFYPENEEGYRRSVWHLGHVLCTYNTSITCNPFEEAGKAAIKFRFPCRSTRVSLLSRNSISAKLPLRLSIYLWPHKSVSSLLLFLPQLWDLLLWKTNVCQIYSIHLEMAYVFIYDFFGAKFCITLGNTGCSWTTQNYVAFYRHVLAGLYSAVFICSTRN